MKKSNKKWVALLLAVCVFVLLAAGCGGSGSSSSAVAPPSSSTSVAPSSSAQPAAEDAYYVGASWNGYLPDDAASRLEKVDGYDNLYSITVTLTDEQMDPTYGGHFYKVTNGTWDAAGCWGADAYTLQPALQHSEGAGLGSVYIDRSGTYTIYFNAENKTLFDTFAAPRIYGDFNTAMGRGADWTFDENALVLLDLDFDGVFEGTFTFPVYAGEGEGYMMALATSVVYFEEWDVWGVGTQYLFDGNEAAMGSTEIYAPEVDTEVTFSYNPATHVTTMTEKAL